MFILVDSFGGDLKFSIYVYEIDMLLNISMFIGTPLVIHLKCSVEFIKINKL